MHRSPATGEIRRAIPAFGGWRQAVKATDLFVKCLEAEGNEYVFGIPGEENADFMM